MQGFAGGQSCWPNVWQAAVAQCGSVGGSSSTGPVSCTEVSDVTESGATLHYQWATPTGPVTSAVVVALPTCERFDFGSYWAPLLSATFVAVVAVVAAKQLVRPFRRDAV